MNVFMALQTLGTSLSKTIKIAIHHGLRDLGLSQAIHGDIWQADLFKQHVSSPIWQTFPQFLYGTEPLHYTADIWKGHLIISTHKPQKTAGFHGSVDYAMSHVTSADKIRMRVTGCL